MTNQGFINAIAPLIQKYAKQYGYGVPSAIIAQACLESAYGTSNKAEHHNYFGLKYRPNRLTCSSGFFKAGSQEQYKNGSYVKVVDNWFGFASMEKGVEGYFQFIAISNYDKARKQTEPKAYLQALKDAGYATSLSYVDNNMAVISKWNLTKYDADAADPREEEAKVSRPAVTRMISKYNFESRSGNSIQYIVLHYTGNRTDTAKANAGYFAGGSRGASAHYFVDETSIYQSVDDSNAAWHVGKNYGSNNLFGKCTNKNSIGIELCSRNSAIVSKTIAQAVALVKYLMQLYDVPAERVVRHYDVCSKSCPGWSGWLPPNESTWNDFKEQIVGAQTSTGAGSTTGSSAAKTTTNTITKKTGYSGVFPALPPRGYYQKGDGITTLKNYPTQIKRVQMLMNWAVNAKLAVDGQYGPATTKAVNKFKKKVGLRQDGCFNLSTLKAAREFRK